MTNIPYDLEDYEDGSDISGDSDGEIVFLLGFHEEDGTLRGSYDVFFDKEDAQKALRHKIVDEFTYDWVYPEDVGISKPDQYSDEEWENFVDDLALFWSECDDEDIFAAYSQYHADSNEGWFIEEGFAHGH
jgi:hypothetical protein